MEYVITVWNEDGSFFGSPPVPFPSRELAEVIAAGMSQLPEAQGKLLDVITMQEYEDTLCPVHKVI